MTVTPRDLIAALDHAQTPLTVARLAKILTHELHLVAPGKIHIDLLRRKLTALATEGHAVSLGHAAARALGTPNRLDPANTRYWVSHDHAQQQAAQRGLTLEALLNEGEDTR